MSGHFVYEIDERKLRVRLQEFEVEPKQEAWSNFEAYYHSVHQQKNDRQGLKFNVPISMNVLLPIVFGGVIILIAILLFQFVSIKNPPVNEAETEKLQNPSVIDTVPAKTEKPLVLTHLDSISKGLILVQSTTVVIQNSDSLKSAPGNTIETLPLNAVKPVLSNSVTNSDTGRKSKETIKENKEAKSEKEAIKPKKKKSKKSSVEAAEQDKLIEELPGNTVDENGASLKPNTP